MFAAVAVVAAQHNANVLKLFGLSAAFYESDDTDCAMKVGKLPQLPLE